MFEFEFSLPWNSSNFTIGLEVFDGRTLNDKVFIFDDKQLEKASIVIDECLGNARWIDILQTFLVEYDRHLPIRRNEQIIVNKLPLDCFLFADSPCERIWSHERGSTCKLWRKRKEKSQSKLDSTLNPYRKGIAHWKPSFWPNSHRHRSMSSQQTLV